MAEPDPVVPELVPVLAGVEEEATGEEAMTALDAAALDMATTVADETAGEPVGIAPDGETVMKTPPEAEAAEACAGAEVGATEEAAAELALEGAPVAATAAAQDGPVGADGVAVAVPNCSRESPGAGNLRSVESTVPQSELGMFATNMLGKASYAAVSRSTNMV